MNEKRVSLHSFLIKFNSRVSQVKIENRKQLFIEIDCRRGDVVQALPKVAWLIIAWELQINLLAVKLVTRRRMWLMQIQLSLIINCHTSFSAFASHLAVSNALERFLISVSGFLRKSFRLSTKTSFWQATRDDSKRRLIAGLGPNESLRGLFSLIVQFSCQT